MKRELFFLTSWVLLASFAGCGRPVIEPGSRLNIVTGNIEFADKKKKIDDTDHATIQFHLKDGGSKDKKILGTLIDGAYSLSTEEAGEKILGAPEGDYIVTITPSKSHPQAIPAKYRDPTTSDLTAHVEEGINTDIDFEIK